MEFDEYYDKVFEYLEYLNYPEMVESFNANDVASTIAATIVTSRESDISPIMCAVIIWSLTLKFQVIPSVSGKTIH